MELVTKDERLGPFQFPASFQLPIKTNEMEQRTVIGRDSMAVKRQPINGRGESELQEIAIQIRHRLYILS